MNSGAENQVKWTSKDSWTQIYDEAFEINFAEYSIFTFFYLEDQTKEEVDKMFRTDCSKTLLGWYRKGDQKGCVRGEQTKKTFKVDNFSINKEKPKLLAAKSIMEI